MSENSFGTSGVRGFGRILSNCLERRYWDERNKGKDISRTELVAELFPKNGQPSARTVWRIMESETWPQSDTVRRLGVVFPRLETIAEESDTVRGNWAMAYHDQATLPDKSTITIMTSDESPKALDDRKMAKSVAKNILQKQCHYVFLFPPFPEKELKFVHMLLTNSVAAALHEFDDGEKKEVKDKIGDLLQWEPYIKDHLHAFQTSESPDSWVLWGKAPRYTVLYNVLSADRDKFPSYGMYYTKGVSILSSPTNGHPDSASGWEFLDQAEADALLDVLEAGIKAGAVEKEEYSDHNAIDRVNDNLPIFPDDAKKWPAPGSE